MEWCLFSKLRPKFNGLGENWERCECVYHEREVCIQSANSDIKCVSKNKFGSRLNTPRHWSSDWKGLYKQTYLMVDQWKFKKIQRIPILMAVTQKRRFKQYQCPLFDVSQGLMPTYYPSPSSNQVSNQSSMLCNAMAHCISPHLS